RGGIVLHLLARAKVILARALRWGAQLCCPDPACERAVGLPRRRDELCPARALEIWLAAAGIASGPIFRMISKGGIVAASRLTPLSVNRIVKKRLGIDNSAHGLRAGFVTEGAARGATAQEIIQTSRHKSVDQVNEYVRHATIFDGTAPVGLARG